MTITFLGAPTGGLMLLPVYSFRVPAGFPSPAADHLERHISLDELFDLRAPHVYLVQVEGDSMQGAGIFSGDLLIVDRSREAEHGDIVIAAINTEPVCKRLYGDDREFGKNRTLSFASSCNQFIVFSMDERKWRKLFDKQIGIL
ncbi:peptidase S24 [Pseudomonas sp. NC26]|jgi:DNA polymerase V|uniref:Peptidase S24 n=1 Tax=Pseudomonas asiatica TaxID=2219225 RepID=A0A9X4I0H9_9PSED|nr:MULTISPECIES: S24 family peptidase [Pseudomonas]MCE0852192.1 peptidase S24 [Pseudomonas asiatica]MCK2120636.1 peptidase S24 [Pseudomonas sp. PNPG3]MDD2115866.1 peptidase S24 [Pseudomonas asiatica]MDG9811485.1 peptidase S24 [Pseudomonas juntendi]MEC4878626.1 peptidase S24 [Pseudomonas sp. NC26]